MLENRKMKIYQSLEFVHIATDCEGAKDDSKGVAGAALEIVSQNSAKKTFFAYFARMSQMRTQNMS